ncbi:acyl-CoA dehydrogenase family protein [Sandarakinorhabdus limnophila]|uniref:acyl-CoA dehydrogenase family protein n=1 Tax=Sandarakinorhabdus limnophila TaxID=210512 RepID=UPI0026F24239|nr:acyl-CoA dehydrogenase family protein [Sandarakinorhabdus limnophila]MCM0031619.1 acyl-CoA dehydrogenase family protein [Sandarakinorhabdus limnophila]
MIAQSLLETVAARAADTEAQRHLPADLAAELAQAGLFRMLVPRSLGGAEVDVATLFNRLEQLGRADAATGWCVMIGGTTALISAWLPLEHAREIWADPNVITGGVFAPMGRATVDGENYLVSGRWAWGSGSANCSWLLGGAVIMEGGEMRRLPNGAPDHRMMVMRRHEVELIDTWDALGMRGTGSGDLEAKDVRVPQGRSVSFITDTPREDGPLYRFAPFGLLALGIAAVASGNALGALDDLKALAVAKKGQGSSRSLAERGVVQADFAVAQADLGAARALVHAEIAAAWERVVAGDTLDLPSRARLRLAATRLTQVSARVAAKMHELAGGTSVYASHPLNRRFRDAHVATQHVMVAPPTLELAGRVLLGLPVDASML